MNDPQPLTVEWFAARIDHPTVNGIELNALWSEACRCELRGDLRAGDVREIEKAIEAKRRELDSESDQLLVGAAKLPRQRSLF